MGDGTAQDDTTTVHVCFVSVLFSYANMLISQGLWEKWKCLQRWKKTWLIFSSGHDNLHKTIVYYSMINVRAV